MLAALRRRIEPAGDTTHAYLAFTPGGTPYFYILWENGNRWNFLVHNWPLFMDAIDPVTQTVDSCRVLDTLFSDAPGSFKEGDR